MKELLKFIQLKKYIGETKKYAVYSRHSDDYLGLIHWRSGWRCYVMLFNEEIDMSVGCMIELCAFINKLEKERKEKNA